MGLSKFRIQSFYIMLSKEVAARHANFDERGDEDRPDRVLPSLQSTSVQPSPHPSRYALKKATAERNMYAATIIFQGDLSDSSTC